MTKMGFNVLAFLDDFAGCESSYVKAMAAYDYFITLTTSLGLKLSMDKCQPPCNIMQWFGYDVDTCLMIIAIPSDRLLQVLHECTLWLS